MQDFYSCHRPWFSFAAYIMCRRLGRPLNFRTEGMRVDLSCRVAGPEGNPATRYKLEDMTLVSLEGFQSHATPLTGQSLAEVFGKDRKGSSGDPEFEKTLTIIMASGDWTSLVFHQSFMQEPEMMMADARLGDRWLEGFQSDINRGLVPRINENKLGLVMGTMVKHGHHWRWEEVSDTDESLVSEVMGPHIPSIFDA